MPLIRLPAPSPHWMGRREKRRRPRVSFAPPAGRRWPAGRMRGGAVRPSLSLFASASVRKPEATFGKQDA
ncbi:hypothetical protein CN153_21970 [Sinorhizobium meliloti]|nr:hypothetical protein DA102_022430 [Sinorhizobium meliloti]RVG72027.1 hypothetical protein CN220_12310 [Sinorhizobium meliloti]RVH83670.1 hypothetical protein CN199_33925 [Sinorhizobium meliloti]RVK83557.1 hypothetical protein CN153_21970 [Sinorhizobium meliloti]RVL22388.1 hypothetical protein CN143_06795 [Sinorhizobium meliloti]